MRRFEFRPERVLCFLFWLKKMAQYAKYCDKIRDEKNTVKSPVSAMAMRLHGR